MTIPGEPCRKSSHLLWKFSPEGALENLKASIVLQVQKPCTDEEPGGSQYLPFVELLCQKQYSLLKVLKVESNLTLHLMEQYVALAPLYQAFRPTDETDRYMFLHCYANYVQSITQFPCWSWVRQVLLPRSLSQPMDKLSHVSKGLLPQAIWDREIIWSEKKNFLEKEEPMVRDRQQQPDAFHEWKDKLPPSIQARFLQMKKENIKLRAPSVFYNQHVDVKTCTSKKKRKISEREDSETGTSTTKWAKCVNLFDQICYSSAQLPTTAEQKEKRKGRWPKNLVWAGGSLMESLDASMHLDGSDVDLFILNHDFDLLEKLLFALHVLIIRRGDRYSFITWKKDVITIISPHLGISIQLILTSMKEPWKVINQFDLDYVKMYFAGEKVYMFPEAELAWQSRTVTVGKNPIYASRVGKVYRRGFTFHPVFFDIRGVKTPLRPSRTFVNDMETTSTILPSSISPQVSLDFLAKALPRRTDYDLIIDRWSPLEHSAWFYHIRNNCSTFKLPFHLCLSPSIPDLSDSEEEEEEEEEKEIIWKSRYFCPTVQITIPFREIRKKKVVNGEAGAEEGNRQGQVTVRMDHKVSQHLESFLLRIANRLQDGTFMDTKFTFLPLGPGGSEKREVSTTMFMISGAIHTYYNVEGLVEVRVDKSRRLILWIKKVSESFGRVLPWGLPEVDIFGFEYT
jgi:hypothetical protein